MAFVISIGTVVVYVLPMVLTGIVVVSAAAVFAVSPPVLLESESCTVLKMLYGLAFVYPWQPEVCPRLMAVIRLGNAAWKNNLRAGNYSFRILKDLQGEDVCCP